MDKINLVSIVLPSFNGEKYIKQSIESCLNQTYKNIELIVVDDCSSDRTPEIVKSFPQENIRYLRNEANLGLAKSLNVGFKQAKGEYLTWASDDNYYSDDAIKTMVEYLDLHPETGFVYSNFYQIDENGDIKKIFRTAGPDEIEMKNCIGPSFLYRRSVYEEIGGYNPDFFLAEDYEYWLRVNKKFKINKIEGYLCYYRLHPKSLRSKNESYKIEEQAELASDKLVRPAMRYYHKGKTMFRKKDYGNALGLLLKAFIREPLNIGIFQLLLLVSVAALSPSLAEKIEKIANK